MSESRITQKDVARAAGLTRPAVSLAFKRHPSIPPATRDRILRIAEELGYRPDPMLAALAAYRMRSQPPSYQGTLAWLVNVREARDRCVLAAHSDYFHGAKEQASRKGYQLEIFNLARPGLTPERMACVLHARNITGLLLGPQLPLGPETDFPWDHFSAVTVGHISAIPELHAVTSAHYRAMLQIVQLLRARNYRRIGFIAGSDGMEGSQHHYLAGLLVRQHLDPDLADIPALQDPYSAKSLRDWLATHQPDAIIAGTSRVLALLQESDIRLPEEVGLACAELASPESAVAGVFHDVEHIGRIAVDLVVGLINRGERGVPVQAQHVQLANHWVEGSSLRPGSDTVLHAVETP